MLDLTKPHKMVTGGAGMGVKYFQDGQEYDGTGKFIQQLKNTCKFICPVCEKGFDIKSKYEGHVKWHKDVDMSKIKKIEDDSKTEVKIEVKK